MNVLQFIILIILGSGLVILQVTWLGSFAWVGQAVNLPLLLVLIVAARADALTSLILVLALSLVYQLFSPLPGWMHPIGFIVAAVGAWFIAQRLVTNRNSTRLVLSVLGGTVAYYLIMAGLITGNRLLHDASLIPRWSSWLTAVGWQLLMHPLLASVWWIISRQRQAALRINSRGSYGG